MSTTQDNLGERLRSAREAKGLSAQKAADAMHLDAWIIEALENGDYARIGPAVYGKGHLKRYAGLLGLPAAEVLDAYGTRCAAPLAAAQASPLRVRTSPPAADQHQWVPIAALIAALSLVGLYWWRPWQPRIAALPPAPTAPAAPAARSPASPADVADEPVAQRVGTTAGGAKAATAPAAPAAARLATATAAAAAGDADSASATGRARLRLSFSADSWVDVHDAAGRRLYAGNGRANTVRTIAGDAPMKVYLGYASGVQLEVNNHVVAIGPQFVAGAVAHFEAGADGVLRRDRDAHPATANNPHPRG